MIGGKEMKNKSLFFQILFLIIVIFLCVALTITVALLAGSTEAEFFDFKKLNIGNMIPVFIFGGLFTCFAVVISLLFTTRTLFYKLKELFECNNTKKDK